MYFRVYSGTFKAGERILNATKDKDERTMRLVRVSADAFEDVKVRLRSTKFDLDLTFHKRKFKLVTSEQLSDSNIRAPVTL